MSLSTASPPTPTFNMELACNSSISVLAFVKFVLVLVKLVRNPWLSLSIPAIGKVPSMSPGVIFDAMIINSLYYAYLSVVNY